MRKKDFMDNTNGLLLYHDYMYRNLRMFQDTAEDWEKQKNVLKKKEMALYSSEIKAATSSFLLSRLASLIFSFGTLLDIEGSFYPPNVVSHYETIKEELRTRSPYYNICIRMLLDDPSLMY